MSSSATASSSGPEKWEFAWPWGATAGSGGFSGFRAWLRDGGRSVLVWDNSGSFCVRCHQTATQPKPNFVNLRCKLETGFRSHWAGPNSARRSLLLAKQRLAELRASKGCSLAIGEQRAKGRAAQPCISRRKQEAPVSWHKRTMRSATASR